MKKQSNLGFLLEISGREKFKLYLAALFSIISSLLAIVPYILMYNIVLEFFGNTVDYPEIKSIEDVIKAARIANFHEFIDKLENKYDTMVGEGGSTLSGGEKQRISIARAILKDAPIVHRLNTIKDANQIIVLNEGYIEEKGSHKELIENKKRYYNMYNEMEKAQNWAI